MSIHADTLAITHPMIQAICPRCEVVLRRRRSGGVAQEVCVACFGFAIDFSELHRIVPSETFETLWHDSEQTALGDASCSHCRQPMHTLAQGEGDARVQLDLCRRCNLLWLDTGEWAAVQESVNAHKPNLERAHEVRTWKLFAALIGLPAEQDQDAFARDPWLTWGLIGLCTLVSLAAFWYMDFALHTFAHFRGQPFPYGELTALSSFFIHGSIFHLAFNMYFLWVFGDNVEDDLGTGKYILLIVLATMAGAFLADWLDPRLTYIPGIGASGGISGLIAYYLLRFPHRRFVVMIFFRSYFIPAAFFGLFYLALEVLGGFQQMGGASMVSHLAHLGGAAVGALFALHPSRLRRSSALARVRK